MMKRIVALHSRCTLLLQQLHRHCLLLLLMQQPMQQQL
jgi:hypothetical protein